MTTPEEANAWWELIDKYPHLRSLMIYFIGFASRELIIICNIFARWLRQILLKEDRSG